MPPHDPKPDLHQEEEEEAAASAAVAVATAVAGESGAATTAVGAVEVSPPSTTPACKPTACTLCGDEFRTRSALFRHLQNPPEHCSSTLRQDAGEKVLLLLGYDCSARDAPETASARTLQGPPSAAARTAVAGGDNAAGLVLQALGVGGAEQDPLARPAGFSQASSVGSRSCPLLVQEPGVSATADTVCLRAPTTVPLEGIHAWLDETNALLDGTGVRLLGRMQVVAPTFHAEIHATRRRYEYLLPAWLLDEAAEGPWPGPPRGQENLIPLLKQLRGRALRPFGHCNGSSSGKRRRCPLWHNFSDSAVPHSPSAARRLFRFYASEIVELRGADYLCLSVSGDAFVSQQVRGMVGLAVAAARGLISAADIAACIDPTRREDLLPLPFAPVAPCSLAEIGYPSWQTKLGGYCMSPGAEERSASPLEGWSDEAARSDAASFRRSVLDNAAGWWEDRRRGADWLRDVLQPGALKLRREIDAANERKLSAGAGAASGEPEPLPADAVLALKEAPAAFANVLRWLKQADASGRWPDSTPSRSLVIEGGNEDSSSGGKSKAGKSKGAANGRERAGGGGRGKGRGRGRAARAAEPATEEEAGGVEGGGGRGRGKGQGKGRGARAAEAATEEKFGGVEVREGPPQQQELQQQQQEEEEEEQKQQEHKQQEQQQEQQQQQQEQKQQEQPQQEQQQGQQEQQQQQEQKQQQQQQQQPQQRGGSFTVGAFPPPCPPPRGNRLFPELARAAFELEAILLPDRPPSTTIAVNRHARFRPHVDSGAGAGQSRSLIVGLGDYTGGDLVVEGEAEDIRYRPLEFNGWTQRHWTRPFRGERYSLVWFTPKGCEGVTGDARFSVPVEGDAGEIGGDAI